MQKILVVGILIIILTSGVRVEGKSLEVSSSLTYNKFNYSFYKDGVYDQNYIVQEDLMWGLGYYVESTYWLKDDFALALGFDMARANWKSGYDWIRGREDFEYENRIFGPVINLKYKLNEYLTFESGIAYYKFSQDLYVEYSWQDRIDEQRIKEGTALGGLVGLRGSYMIDDNLNIDTTLSYRSTKINLDDYNDETLKIRGLSISGGISYRF